MIDAGIGAALARGIAPPDRSRTSAWAERNIRLTSDLSAERPGMFDTGYLPWSAALLDLAYDHPGRLGFVAPKASQVGFTTSMLILEAHQCATRDGMLIHMMETDAKAANYAEKFRTLCKGSDALSERFGRALTGRTGDDRRRSLLDQIPFPGGRIDFAGGQAAGNFTSEPYWMIVGDEIEQIFKHFPKELGDPVDAMRGRIRRFRRRGLLMLFSHPTRKGVGIDALFEQQTDRSEWCFDCPRCAATIFPRASGWALLVKHPDGEPDKAMMHCPHCGTAISEHERRRLVWPASRGGSGRFASPLPPDAAARFEFMGCAIHGLCDPKLDVPTIAARLERASEGQRQAILNMELSEAYTPASTVITPEVIDKCVLAVPRGWAPPGPSFREGIAFVTVGVDVQAAASSATIGEVNPTMYVRLQGYTREGVVYLLDRRLIRGNSTWAQLSAYLSGFIVEVERRAELGGGRERMGVRAMGIDAGYLTSHVLDYCRHERVVNPLGQVVRLVPMQYEPRQTADQPWAMAPERKRIKPGYEHLGPMDRYYLHRHTWVDRELSLWFSGQMRATCPIDGEFAAQMLAQVLAPVSRQHGLEIERFEWERPKDKRDDWLQAGSYATAVAAIALHLDRLGTLPAENPHREPAVASPFDTLPELTDLPGWG